MSRHLDKKGKIGLVFVYVGRRIGVPKSYCAVTKLWSCDGDDETLLFTLLIRDSDEEE